RPAPRPAPPPRPVSICLDLSHGDADRPCLRPWPIWSQFFGVQEGGSRPSPGHVDVGQLLGSTVEGVATSGAGQGVLTFTTCNGSSLGILLPGTLLPAEQRRT